MSFRVFFFYICVCVCGGGARGNVVCCTVLQAEKGRGFDSCWVNRVISIDQILAAALCMDPGVDPAYNRNEYHDSSSGGEPIV
jgi:hypothetical protein